MLSHDESAFRNIEIYVRATIENQCTTTTTTTTTTNTKCTDICEALTNQQNSLEKKVESLNPDMQTAFNDWNTLLNQWKAGYCQ